jgi:hypothetical protein
MSLTTRRAREAQQRRALKIQVAVAYFFRTEDLEAIGAAMGIDEPSRNDLRRWMGAVVRRAVEDARKRFEEGMSPEERDDLNF